MVTLADCRRCGGETDGAHDEPLVSHAERRGATSSAPRSYHAPMPLKDAHRFECRSVKGKAPCPFVAEGASPGEVRDAAFAHFEVRHAAWLGRCRKAGYSDAKVRASFKVKGGAARPSVMKRAAPAPAPSSTRLPLALRRALAGAPTDTLVLARQRLDRVPPEVARLPKLRSLDLSQNMKLHALHDAVAKLRHLRVLRLGVGPVGRSRLALPAWLGELRDLEELDLEGRLLSRLPEALFTLTRLRFLSLRRNELETVDGIERLTNLELLDLSYNALRDLPPALSRLKKLRELRISCRPSPKLRDLEGELLELVKLPRLRVLIVANAGLRTFPPVLARFTRLEELSLANNSLKTLPDELAGMTALRRLDLYGNDLGKVAPRSLPLPPSLQAVRLRSTWTTLR